MEGSGALFGRGLGRVLGEVWRLWRPRGSFFGIIFSCLYLGWFWQVVLEASGLDFGSILGCFGGILGGFGECFWRGTHFEFKRGTDFEQERVRERERSRARTRSCSKSVPRR